MKTAIKWFAGFFEDQGNSASSKRITLYVALGFFYLLLKGSLEGKTINEYILYGVILIIFVCLGTITGEFITMFYGNKKEETKPE